MRNKLKLSLIAIATIVAGNSNAQTFYSCIPQGCPAGQYFDGKSCLDLPKLTACPSGQYFDGVNCLALPTGGHSCSAGYVWDDSQSACFKETCTFNIDDVTEIVSTDPSVSYTKGKETEDYCSGYQGNYTHHYTYTVTMKHGDCITYNWAKQPANTPGCQTKQNQKSCCNQR